MPREINYQGVKIKIVSKAEMAKILGIKFRKLENWLAQGVIYPPALIDKNNLVKAWSGKLLPRVYYLYREAIEIRSIMRGRVFQKGKVLPEEFINKVHTAMATAREQLKNCDVILMDYPLILEFDNQKDLREHLSKFMSKKALEDESILDGLVKGLYLKGNKLRGVKNGKNNEE